MSIYDRGDSDINADHHMPIYLQCVGGHHVVDEMRWSDLHQPRSFEVEEVRQSEGSFGQTVEIRESQPIRWSEEVSCPRSEDQI